MSTSESRIIKEISDGTLLSKRQYVPNRKVKSLQKLLIQFINNFVFNNFTFLIFAFLPCVPSLIHSLLNLNENRNRGTGSNVYQYVFTFFLRSLRKNHCKFAILKMSFTIFNIIFPGNNKFSS